MNSLDQYRNRCLDALNVKADGHFDAFMAVEWLKHNGPVDEPTLAYLYSAIAEQAE